MAKDYNIDDILSEVKQRRAEQESNLKAAPAPKAAPVQTDAKREAYAGKLVEELLGPGMCHILHIRPQGGCVVLK